ncbi:MAG TPA: hypothetical protein VKZ63_01910, partial [Kofleriaceae bacterium]|nr:hypothetical protein [Kofleriaceae bacterium]
MLPIHAYRKLIAAAALAGLALVGRAEAQPSSGSGGQSGVVIDIDNPQRSKYPLAIPSAGAGDPATGKTIAEVANFDMKVAGWFRPLDTSTYRGDLRAEGLGIDLVKWRQSGAFGVMKFRSEVRGDSLTIDFKLYEIEKGNRPVLERTYKGSVKDVRKLTHMWCNEVVKYFTGEPGFFGSKIIFSTSAGNRRKRVAAMDFDGHGLYSVSRNTSINILPAFSPDGNRVAFTSYMRGNPDLYVSSVNGGSTRRVSYRRGMNTGASWSPDGSKLAVTLSIDGQPEIYVIDVKSGKKLRRLTNNRAIDSGAAWSPDG